MDIPDYIASSGSGKGTIKRMSDRMKAMGRKKRIRKSQLLLEWLDYSDYGTWVVALWWWWPRSVNGKRQTSIVNSCWHNVIKSRSREVASFPHWINVNIFYLINIIYIIYKLSVRFHNRFPWLFSWHGHSGLHCIFGCREGYHQEHVRQDEVSGSKIGEDLHISNLNNNITT